MLRDRVFESPSDDPECMCIGLARVAHDSLRDVDDDDSVPAFDGPEARHNAGAPLTVLEEQ